MLYNYNTLLLEITNFMINVGIIGANGYTGYELMRLLTMHNSAKVVFASSRTHAGKKITDLYPSLYGFYGDMCYDSQDMAVATKKCDVIFTCLPHGLSAEAGGEVIKAGKKLIDLSADFRYDDIKLFEKIYGITHPCKDLNSKAIYGLCELNRDKIKNTNIVANPGCYTTASILALYPLIKGGLIDNNNIIIDAKSGASGAGRKDDVSLSVCESGENFKAYGVTTHRHQSEIEEKLSINSKIKLNFTPHLLPISRGILATIYTSLKADKNAVKDAYKSFYGKETFVKVHFDGTMPDIKWVKGSNMCQIGYKICPSTNKLIIVSVIDNLIKGASGQAIQNMNILFNLPESTGLPVAGLQL